MNQSTELFLKQQLLVREKRPYSEIFWSECRKIRTRKTPNTDTFHAVFQIYIDYIKGVSLYLFTEKLSKTSIDTNIIYTNLINVN